MNFFLKLKNILFKNKMKRISSESNSEKIIKIALKEKNPDRIMELLSNTGFSLTSEEISRIIEKLPINRRVEAMRIAKRYLTPYDLFEMINHKLDTSNKLLALNEFQNQLDLYDIYKIFDNLSPDKRTEALNMCIDRFDSFSLGELVKLYIPLSERAEILDKYNQLIDSYSKADILKKLIPDETIKGLEKYAGELSSNNIFEIITALPNNNVFFALEVSYQYLIPNQIKDIIMYYIPEYKRLEILEICSDRLDISNITDIINNSIPEKDREEAIIKLIDKLDLNHIEEIVQDLNVSSDFYDIVSIKFEKNIKAVE